MSEWWEVLFDIVYDSECVFIKIESKTVIYAANIQIMAAKKVFWPKRNSKFHQNQNGKVNFIAEKVNFKTEK